MKRVLLLSLMVLFVTGTAFAQLPPRPYIGLFTSDAHDTWCAIGDPSPFYLVEMWIMCLPSVNGMLCAEFAISYPASSVITGSITSNTAIISVAQGDIATGMSVCYIACEYAWNWCFHQTFYVNGTDQVYAELVPHGAPQITQLQFASCEDDTYPLEEAVKFTNLYINYDPVTAPECQVTGTESKSWGAIKAMVGE